MSARTVERPGIRCDVVLAGVGGQGVLSAAGILAEAALREGLTVRQGEIHGMSQRGGAVRATLRMADSPVPTDLVGRGGAHLVLGLEPVEALRNLDYLSPGGTLVTSTTPFANIPDYPDEEALQAALNEVPGAVLVDGGALAREAGHGRAENVVMLGAACLLLPVSAETLWAVVEDAFRPRGEKLVDTNLRAFEAGRAAARTPGTGVGLMP